MLTTDVRVGAGQQLQEHDLPVRSLRVHVALERPGQLLERYPSFRFRVQGLAVAGIVHKLIYFLLNEDGSKRTEAYALSVRTALDAAHHTVLNPPHPMGHRSW